MFIFLFSCPHHDKHLGLLRQVQLARIHLARCSSKGGTTSSGWSNLKSAPFRIWVSLVAVALQLLLWYTTYAPLCRSEPAAPPHPSAPGQITWIHPTSSCVVQRTATCDVCVHSRDIYIYIKSIKIVCRRYIHNSMRFPNSSPILTTSRPLVTRWWPPKKSMFNDWPAMFWPSSPSSLPTKDPPSPWSGTHMRRHGIDRSLIDQQTRKLLHNTCRLYILCNLYIYIYIRIYTRHLYNLIISYLHVTLFHLLCRDIGPTFRELSQRRQVATMVSVRFATVALWQQSKRQTALQPFLGCHRSPGKKYGFPYLEESTICNNDNYIILVI